MTDIRTDDHPTTDELASLYESVGWSAYTKDIQELHEAVEGSTYIATARDDGILVGLVRAISDDRSITYIQDLLIHPDHQRLGLGTRLMKQCLERFDHVRTIMLLTDHEKMQHDFYASMGFTNTRDTGLHSFIRLRRP